MMYFAPRQIDGKWYYCCNGAKIAYCSPLHGCKECNGWGRFYIEGKLVDCESCEGAGLLPTLTPCGGHDTEEEACNHYKEYLLDNRVRYSKDVQSQRKCEICKEWTQGLAWVGGYQGFQLCEKHQNRESLEKLLEVGISWES